MTQEELGKVKDIFPNAKAEDRHECHNCDWDGSLSDLGVMYGVSERPRILTCPGCKADLIHTAPHSW